MAVELFALFSFEELEYCFFLIYKLSVNYGVCFNEDFGSAVQKGLAEECILILNIVGNGKGYNESYDSVSDVI